MTDPLILAAAEEDYTESLAWYAEHSQLAAAGFEAEFERAVEAIKSDPERFPYCDSRHRYYLMRRYPFQVVYRQYQDRLVIVAVAHAKRTPHYWSRR